MTGADDWSAEDTGTAVQSAGLGAWWWDPGTQTVGLNRAAARLLGCARVDPHDLQEFLGLVHAGDRAGVTRALQDGARTGQAFDVDFRTIHPTAAVGWIRARGRGAATPAPRVYGILIDVDQRKAAEEANSRLAAIVMSSDDAIIAKTLDGIVTDWNRGAETVFGYTAEEMVGRPISLLLPPGQVNETVRILQQIRRDERVEHYETRRRRKDGRIIDVSITVSPVYDGDGRLLGASKVARDITRAKQADADLREREARLQSVLETVPDAMIVIDQIGTIQSFSQAAERSFGYTAGECIGLNVRMLMPEPDRGQHDGYLRNYMTTGVKKIIGIGRISLGRRKDGTTFPIEILIGEVPGWTGSDADQRLFIGFIRDLTEREFARRQLQDLQAELVHMSRLTAMGEMASTLAHELNQPLTAIASYLKGMHRLLARDASPAPDMLRGAVDEAAGQALRAGQIIRRLRDFVARGETDRHVESLARLIEEASALALVGIAATGVHSSLLMPADNIRVLVDRIQIQQVIVNLVRNAIEAMQDCDRRALTISTAPRDADTVEIAVGDTGTGLSAEAAANLFRPFHSTKPQGLGVGLSISRTIVEAHGGRLWAEPNPGGGTVFRMTLRLFQATEAMDGS